MDEKYNMIQVKSGTVLYIPKKEENESKQITQQTMNYENFINILSEIIVKYK